MFDEEEQEVFFGLYLHLVALIVMCAGEMSEHRCPYATTTPALFRYAMRVGDYWIVVNAGSVSMCSVPCITLFCRAWCPHE